MKSAVAATLICALAIPSLAAAQPDVAWSKVRELPRGSRMMLAKPGEHSHTAYFFFADDTGFKALNVSDIEPRAAKALRRTASDQPDLLMRVTSGTSVLVDKEIVLTASGLFVGNRKIAEYDRIIESISRSDVETGVVRLEDVIAVVVAAPFLFYPIACMTQGCD